MTTATTIGIVSNASDADFRNWTSEYNTLLTTTGFAQSSDTGQINFTTVTRPATNTYAGYGMYYLNDSLHSTRPIYLKVEYGFAGSTSSPQLRYTIGFQTDGTGGFIGTVAGPYVTNSAGATNQVLTFPSYAAGGEGYGWIVFKGGAANGGSTYGWGSFAITRSCSINGTPTDEAIGFNMLTAGGQTNNAYYSNIIFAGRATPLIVNNTVQGSIIGGVTDPQLSGADIQYWRTYMATPRVRTNPFIVLTHNSYNSAGSIKNLAPISGAPARNYISMDYFLGQGNCWSGMLQNSTTNSARNCPMLIWE